MMRCFLMFFILSSLTLTAPALANDEAEMQEMPETDTRGTDRAGERDAFDAWAGYFGRDLPDPLDAEEMEEYQENKEDYDRRAQAAAEYTDAATSVVSALPTGNVASTAASMAVSETAEGVVEAETSDEPGFFEGAWEGFKGFISWLNPFD